VFDFAPYDLPVVGGFILYHWLNYRNRYTLYRTRSRGKYILFQLSNQLSIMEWSSAQQAGQHEYLFGESDDWKVRSVQLIGGTNTIKSMTKSHPTKPMIQIIGSDGDDDEGSASSEDDEPPPLGSTTQREPPAMTLLEEMIKEAKQAQAAKMPPGTNAATGRKTSSSGGIRRGFLLSSSTAKKSVAPTKIETKTPDYQVVSRTPHNSLKLPEVQESLQQSTSITQNVLDSIQSHPHLIQALQEPEFSRALEKIRRDPSQAKSILEKNPSVGSMIQEFCGLMGTPEVEKTQQDPEQDRVDKLLADQYIRAALLDPDMQKIMEECSACPGRFQTYITHPKYGPALKLLLQHGLLQVQR